MKKRILALAITATALLAGCGNKTIKVNPNKEKYLVGICQLTQHEALDAATNGFKEGLTAELAQRNRKVDFDFKNGSGDVEICGQAISTFKSEDVDLIMCNATPAVQTAFAATEEIPILGTSVTDYGVATNLAMKDGKSGTNLSGTSDLAKIEDQIDLMLSLLPSSVKKVGILYCSAEANSKFQVDKAEARLIEKGITVEKHSFSESTDISVACNACLSDDAVYIPTDNTVADLGDYVKTAVADKGVPIFAGESGICKKCGFATLSIDYFNLGKITGKMAAEILTGEKDIREYEIQYDTNPAKFYNKSIWDSLKSQGKLGEVPEGFTAL